MPIYFVDTSALAKRYVNEPGSAWLRALLNPTTGAETLIVRIAGNGFRLPVIVPVTVTLGWIPIVTGISVLLADVGRWLGDAGGDGHAVGIHGRPVQSSCAAGSE